MSGQEQKTILFIYAAFIAALVLQFSWTAMLVGTILATVALIIAYRLRKTTDAANPAHSHFHWAIRTFWIGGGVYLPIVTVFASIFLYYQIIPIVTETLNAGIGDPESIKAAIMAKKGREIIIYGSLAFGPFGLWWLWRCIRGIKAALVGDGIESPDSWF